MNSRQGFTLTELSIVLMVIGLISAGIMVGKSLIYSSQLQKTLAQVEKYDAATATFISKYTCLPGDCNNAIEMSLGDASCPNPIDYLPGDAITHPGCNGNGDGHLGDGDPSPVSVCANPYCPEDLNFWYHLMKATLISDTVDGISSEPATAHYQQYILPKFGTATPMTPLRDVPIFAHNDRYYVGNYAYGDNVQGDHPGKLTSKEVYSIDIKYDDGKPYTGNVMLASGSMGGCTAGFGNDYSSSSIVNCAFYMPMLAKRPNP